MTKVFALHGGLFLTANDLRRDMGHPKWVDYYLEGHDYRDLYYQIQAVTSEDVVLVGYSEGGSVVAELTWLLDNISGVVLYESPSLRAHTVYGNFPVMWIRNDYKAWWWREEEFDDTLLMWSKEHTITHLKGQGRHARWRLGWPPVTHAWDRSLNPKIEQFIAGLKDGK